MVGIPIGIVIGFVGWFMLRYIVTSFYTVNQNERAVKTSFGRAQRLGKATVLALPMAEALRPDERERYTWPQLRVIRPGGPYFKLPRRPSTWRRTSKTRPPISTARSWKQ